MLSPRTRVWILIVQLAAVYPASAQDLRAFVGGAVEGVIRSDDAHRHYNPFALRRRPVSEAAGTANPPPSHPQRKQASVADRPAQDPIGRYAVDGLSLFDSVDPKILPRNFVCTPSDLFAGSTWCRSRTNVREAPVATSMLISSARKIVYLNKVYEGASIGPPDAANEIDRLSKRNRGAPRILHAPQGAPAEGVIAIWGSAALDPIDQRIRALLADGLTVDVGILVDFLQNVRESARRGLPVFRLSGGPGYFWSARIGLDGHGSLRFGMSDVGSFDGQPAALASTPNVVAARPVPMPSPAGTEMSEAAQGRQTALDGQVAEAKRLIDAGTAFVKTDPNSPDVLDLVQAISDLNAVLGERDVDTIRRRVQTLSAALHRNPRFAAFQAERADTLKRQNAQAVGDAVQQAQSYRSFLAATVTVDPTSSNVSILLPLIKRLDAAVAKPDAEQLGRLNRAVDLAIRQAGLHDAYGASVAKAAPLKAVAAGEGATEIGTAAAGSRTERRPGAGPGQVAEMPADPSMTADALNALRAEHQESAKKSTSMIDDEIKNYVSKPADTAPVAQQFPEFTEWLDSEISGGWSLSDQSFELADYGVVDWHGHRLPVPMTRVTFHLRNAALGSTKSSCFLFGRIDDAEANAARDPVAIQCNDTAALTRWRTSHAFKSQWNIE